MYYLVVAVVFVAIAACSHAPTKSKLVVQDWERQLIREALRELPSHSAVYVTKFLPEEDPGVLGRACLDCNPCHMQLKADLAPRHYKAVVWHEYGHCAGLLHHGDGIMAPVVYPTATYSEKQKQEFFKLVK